MTLPEFAPLRSANVDPPSREGGVHTHGLLSSRRLRRPAGSSLLGPARYSASPSRSSHSARRLRRQRDRCHRALRPRHRQRSAPRRHRDPGLDRRRARSRAVRPASRRRPGIGPSIVKNASTPVRQRLRAAVVTPPTTAMRSPSPRAVRLAPPASAASGPTAPRRSVRFSPLPLSSGRETQMPDPLIANRRHDNAPAFALAYIVFSRTAARRLSATDPAAPVRSLHNLPARRSRFAGEPLTGVALN